MSLWKRIAAAVACTALLTAQPAQAQSILRDAETEAVLNDMSRPLIEAAGLSPRNVEVVLVGSNSVNAFVAGGQKVYLFSGLLDEADSANEVQGVIAHEIGHITGGHVPLQGQGTQPAIGILLLSMLLGVAAAAAGAGEAAAGLISLGQQAAIAQYLSFSRTQESAADAAAARYLRTSEISGKGFLSFFKKLQNMEYRLAIAQENSYGRTHPLSGERIATLTDDLQAAPGWSKPSDPALEARFKRVQAKLRGYLNDPARVLRLYPTTDVTIPARYARAYAYHRSGYPQQALAEANALVRAEPDDPYFLELLGQILLESGKPVEALAPLRLATEKTNFQPLIATAFGHALVATEERRHLPEAERVLRQAIARDRQNPFAWLQLGTVYERKGDGARTALATAERAMLMNRPPLALASAQAAMGGLQQGTPDYIRAQDIALVARNQVEEMRRNQRNRPPQDQNR